MFDIYYWRDEALNAKEELREKNQLIAILQAQLADFEFLSVEGFLNWQHEQRMNAKNAKNAKNSRGENDD